MEIDESGVLKIKGKKQSDHNTIILKFNIPMEQMKTKKKEIWRINKKTDWIKYIKVLEDNLIKIDTASNSSIQDRYDKIMETIKTSAKAVIGTTKIPSRHKSAMITEARKDRKKQKFRYKQALAVKTRY